MAKESQRKGVPWRGHPYAVSFIFICIARTLNARTSCSILAKLLQRVYVLISLLHLLLLFLLCQAESVQSFVRRPLRMKCRCSCCLMERGKQRGLSESYVHATQYCRCERKREREKTFDMLQIH